MGEKRKRWAPTPKEVNSIEALAQYGMSEERIAHVLGISLSTFELAKKKHDSVRQGLLKGRAVASATVCQTAFEMAISKKHIAMTIFWLKVREGWKETQVIEHSGRDGAPIETTQESRSERQARVESKIEKLKLLLIE